MNSPEACRAQWQDPAIRAARCAGISAGLRREQARVSWGRKPVRWDRAMFDAMLTARRAGKTWRETAAIVGVGYGTVMRMARQIGMRPANT